MKAHTTILSIALLLSVIYVKGQTPKEIWELSSSESGTKDYVAREKIVLKPGFKYTPTSSASFTAKIDPTLLFPPTENTYQDANGNIVTSPLSGSVVGNLSGNFDVSPTGAATYSIPIECPPGINGMQPDISLVYNSQSGAGIAGMCWSIGGLSMISRVPKNYYFDNEKSGIIWDNTSPLALDGKRLIEISRWGTDSIEYCTEDDNTNRIVGYNIKSWGPLYFKVYAKNGNILEYGDATSVDSYFPLKITTEYNDDGIIVNIANNFQNLGWSISKISDANNNYIKYAYTSDIIKIEIETFFIFKWFFHSPRISSISYGHESGTTKETVAQIEFQYLTQTSPYITYLNGLEMSNKYILEDIVISNGLGELHEKYHLSFDTNESMYYLNNITRQNSSVYHILPLKFDWSPMTHSFEYTSGITFSQTPTISALGNESYFRIISAGDMDGDGLTDLIVVYQKGPKENVKQWIAYKNMGNNYYKYRGEFSWDPAWDKVFLFLDLDNDGKDEIYVGRGRVENGGYYYDLNCHTYQNDSLKAYPAGNKTKPINKETYEKRDRISVLAGDFVGNGNQQLIYHYYSGQNIIHTEGMDLVRGIDINTYGSCIGISDINGNGKQELIYRKGTRSCFFEYNKDSRAFELINGLAINGEDTYEIYPFDFNGDGNTDLITKNKKYPYNWRFFISTGGGFAEKDISGIIPKSTSGIYFVDANQDGKCDIIVNHLNSTQAGGSLKLWLSNGNDFIDSGLTTTSDLINKSRGIPSNFTQGHGKELFLYSFYGTSYGVGYIDKPILVTLNKNKWFHKIVKITDSFGKETNINYQDYKFPYTYTPQGSEILNDEYICSSISPNLELVKSIQSTNVNTSFKFNGPLIHKQGRGFLGFEKTEANDALRSQISVSENELDPQLYVLYPYKNTLKSSTGTLISETTNNYSMLNQRYKKYFLRLDSQVFSDKLRGTTITKTYSSYDTYRNPRTITTTYGDGISTTEAITYIQKGSWIPNKIAYLKTTQAATGKTSVARTQYFDYDEKGNILRHVKDSLNTNQMTTAYSEYDKYGNPGKITTTGNGISRSTTMTYTPSGRFPATKTDNQFNEIITYNYDESRGLLTSKTDRIGTTSYQYDGFGRLQLTTYPDNTKTASALQWTGDQGPTGAKYYTYTETSGEPPVITWYDQASREIRKDTYGLNNNKISIDTKYNTIGEIDCISEPYFTDNPGTKIWASTYTYDSYRRPKTVKTPMGTTTYTYSGLKTTVTSPTDAIETTSNSAGWTVSQKTNGKTVTFTHYASGLVQNAIPEGGDTISVTYDLQGNRTKLVDPDAGTITSTYDAWGQLKTEKQQIHISGSATTTTYTYYPSGLLQYKTRNGEKTTYVYDNKYRLSNIAIAGKHSQTFEYDWLDRITKITDIVDNSKTFETGTEYDELGRIKKETYPSGYYTINRYDKYGYLTETIDRNNSSIWKALESNAKGQLTKTAKGGKETTFGFDSKGLPSSILCSGIINMSYGFNTKGNLDYRQDGLTGYKESFIYDSMNRLTNWNISLNGVTQKNNSISFDASTGNIAKKSDLGSYSMNYGENGKPHTLTSISGQPGLIPSTDQNITYTDFKKVKSITEGTNTLNISYGVDEQRIKTVQTATNGTLTRYYLGGYEEEINGSNTRKLHYLSGGDGLVAIYVSNTQGGDTLYYAYTDYQGSLVALTLPSGTIKEKYVFDPWGNRRNPANWTLADARAAFVVNRGYTMHEHLDAFKLINMNGRVYDPLTGMFFSPDPYVQAPGKWLNYNRYSYCLNNPLKYTDPDGEFIHLIIGATIGGTLNWAFNGFKFNAKGLGYFGVGALAGALGAGIGAGISSMLPVVGTTSGGFSAGFLGTSAATTATSSFVSGALIGGGAGLASGFTTGFGNDLLQGGSFGHALGQGGIYGAIGLGSGTLIGGITGGISAVRDGRQFWDGSTVTKDFAVDVNVVSVRQMGDNNCLPASGESINKSLGGDITQGDLRGWVGGNPNLDPLSDVGFWNDTYATNAGHSVQGYSQMGAKHIVPTLNDGGRVAVTIPGSGSVNHSVVVKSVYLQTTVKISGTATRTVMYRVMDPATGGFRNIPYSKIINIFTIRP